MKARKTKASTKKSTTRKQTARRKKLTPKQKSARNRRLQKRKKDNVLYAKVWAGKQTSDCVSRQDKGFRIPLIRK